ncbi:leucine-rich repeat-containing protein 43-like [Pholidichthys leucotaenia]
MSSNKLSVVLEKQIRSLCLNDFPCGSGTWRNSRDSAESTDGLLDLLSCPHSPWCCDQSWSPQASALRQMAVLTPERLHTNLIYNYFTTLRIMDRGVSEVDEGLLKFSNLEELVLSANKILEISSSNLPSTLKILELRANQLSSLFNLTTCPPPSLQYLGLSSNSVGSQEDVSHLTGRHWPQLVCLDLGDCEFEDQQTLLNALRTLPCLRSLVLEGNPLTLAPCYPGFTVDSLPQLLYLDASLISPEERHQFKGLAKMRDLTLGVASVTVHVGKMRGITDPLMIMEEKAPDYPVVTYSYFITYEFLSHQTPANMKPDSKTKSDQEDSSPDTDLQSKSNCEIQVSSQPSLDKAEQTCSDNAHVSRHSTSKLAWSEEMDFNDAQTYSVTFLGSFKKFLNQGLCLRLEEEKVLSWPAAAEDATTAKLSQMIKEKKGKKEKGPPIKFASKDKPKDKKKSAPELIEDNPIRRIICSVNIPLQSLVRGGQKIDLLCDFGALNTHSKVLGTKIKDKYKETQKQGSSSTRPHNATSSKGSAAKGKGRKEKEVDVDTDMSVQLEPVTVELTVELEKWQSTSEAHQILVPDQT